MPPRVGDERTRKVFLWNFCCVDRDCLCLHIKERNQITYNLYNTHLNRVDEFYLGEPREHNRAGIKEPMNIQMSQ